jgi:type I restriction enzyme, R subunit
MPVLRAALEQINPHLPADTLEQVFRKVHQTETPSLIEENRRLHRMMIEGMDVVLSERWAA